MSCSVHLLRVGNLPIVAFEDEHNPCDPINIVQMIHLVLLEQCILVQTVDSVHCVCEICRFEITYTIII